MSDEPGASNGVEGSATESADAADFEDAPTASTQGISFVCGACIWGYQYCCWMDDYGNMSGCMTYSC